MSEAKRPFPIAMAAVAGYFSLAALGYLIGFLTVSSPVSLWDTAGFHAFHLAISIVAVAGIVMRQRWCWYFVLGCIAYGCARELFVLPAEHIAWEMAAVVGGVVLRVLVGVYVYGNKGFFSGSERLTTERVESS